MISFNKYINGTDPGTADETYNYMRGIDANGGVADHTDPITGVLKAFMVDGDPVAGKGWNDENPADRRLMLSSGPFTFAPGDSQEVVCAIIMGQGQDALRKLATKSFDAVLLDIFMPAVDGLEVLRQLRARGDKTKVLILTALNDARIAEQARALGADDFLTKPFDASLVHLRLASAMAAP
jgi:CheY-like chemotaxis protein